MSNRVIFHIDVNSAFLSWEAVYRLKHLNSTLDLRKIPSAIGGDIEKWHGIILANSIPAKKFNIKTGESIMEAKKKCPDLYLAPPNYNLYEKPPTTFIKLLREYTDDVEVYSVDECFVDMMGTEQLFGKPFDVANEIKDRIRSELGFTVNISVSNNKLLAKMASDFKKPDKVHSLFPHEMKEKMWILPINKLFFVGKAIFKKLHVLGIRTIGDLAKTGISILKSHLKKHGEIIWNFANGIDLSPAVSTPPANKGYGNSTTLPFDTKFDFFINLFKSKCDV